MDGQSGPTTRPVFGQGDADKNTYFSLLLRLEPVPVPVVGVSTSFNFLFFLRTLFGFSISIKCSTPLCLSCNTVIDFLKKEPRHVISDKCRLRGAFTASF